MALKMIHRNGVFNNQVYRLKVFFTRVVYSLAPKVINGGVAGMVGIACVFPLDLVKTRLQNQQIGPRGERMYQGITLPLYRQMVAGGLAGFLKVTITTPMELLKIQLQDAGRVAAKVETGGQKLYASHIALGMIKENGVLGLYKGYAATALRDVIFSMLYFPTFSYLNDLGMSKETGESAFWVNFLAGLAAGGFAALSVTPVDVVKTRLQTTTKAPGEKYYTSIPNAFSTIMKEEGPRAFFKGGACRVMVIAPLFAIAQVVYFLGVGEFLLGVDRNKA